MGNEAQATPLEEGPQFHRSSHRLQCLEIALRAHDSRVLVLDLCSPFADLLHYHIDRLDNVQRLETGNHYWFVMVACHKIVRPHADHHADMPWANEAVEPQVWRVENCFHRGNDCHMIAENREILDTLGLCT